jgi:hypothetical protein
MCQLSSQCAFVRRSSRDLDLIFALQFERTVNRDNSVSIQNLSLQIESVRWRATLAGCSVTMHQHLDGTFTITHGPSVWAMATQSTCQSDNWRDPFRPLVQASPRRSGVAAAFAASARRVAKIWRMPGTCLAFVALHSFLRAWENAREIETRDRTSPKEKGRSYGAPQKPQS